MSKELARQVPQAVAKIRNTAITVVGKE
jgi:hypothetical protein